MLEKIINKDQNCSVVFSVYNSLNMHELDPEELEVCCEQLDMLEEELDLFENFGKIIISIDAEDGYNIGHILGYIFEEGFIFEDNLDLVDEIGADLYEFGTSMTKSTLNPLISRGVVKKTFLFIDQFYVVKEYRNQGFGSFVIENIDKIVDVEIASVILDASPTDFSEDQKIAQNRLNEFYERNGLKKQRKSNQKKTTIIWLCIYRSWN